LAYSLTSLGVVFRGVHGLQVSYSLDGQDLFSVANLTPHQQERGSIGADAAGLMRHAPPPSSSY
jgi:hypothetical protein